MNGEQKVIILNNKNQKLVGYFRKGHSKVLMILCHGIQSYNDPSMYKLLKPYFDAYHAMGISLLRFDFTGTGKSEGRKRLHLQQRVSDIGSVIDQYHKEYQEIILNVASLSGIVGAIAVCQYKQITKLMITNGVFNFIQIHPKLKLRLKFYLLLHPSEKQDLRYCSAHYQPEKITIPTLVAVSEKDTIVNPQQSFNFYNHLQAEKICIVIPEADHAVADPIQIKAYFPKVLAWLVKQLNLPIVNFDKFI